MSITLSCVYIKTRDTMEEKLILREGEKGNVLFLILIAVALFAALSYAVTQSTRSGGGSTEREQSILSGASMTQHPTSLRTAIIRMILSGVDVANLEFNEPANFADLTAEEQGVFHPNGGGAVFQSAPADLMATTSQGDWFYNANFDIPNIGQNGVGGNDIIAFLPNITQSICRQINVEFAVDLANCTTTVNGIPDLETTLTESNIKINNDNTTTFPSADQEDLQGAGAGCAAFTGEASGCFNDTDSSEFVFFSVLLER